MKQLRKICFFRKAVAWLIIMAAVTSVQAVCSVSAQAEEDEVYVHGTIEATAKPAMGNIISLKVGDTAVLTINPYVHIQYTGCGVSGCPQKCGGWNCFTVGKGCGCSEPDSSGNFETEAGSPPKRCDTKATVESRNNTVVTVSEPVLEREPKEDEVGDMVSAGFTLKAVGAGTATVVVNAECRDWIPLQNKVFTVGVTDPSAVDPGPSGTPEQPENPSPAPPDSPEQPDPADQDPPALRSDTATMNGSGEVMVSLYSASDEWAEKITAVYVDNRAISGWSAGASGLTIPSSAFIKAKRAAYDIKAEASGYKDFTAQVTVNNYGADKLYIRLLDASGKVKLTKTYTKDEIIKLSDAKDIYYETVCSMRGISTYKAKGIYLSTLLEKAGIPFGKGMTLKLRTNDKASVNDPENEDAYYDAEKGVFSYEDLMQTTRYAFPEIYTDAALKENLLKAGKFDETMRILLAGSSKTEVQPMLAYTYTTNVWNNDSDNDMRS